MANDDDPIEIEVAAPGAEEAKEALDEAREALANLREESGRSSGGRGVLGDDTMARNARSAKTEVGGLTSSVGQLRGAMAAVGFTRVLREMNDLRQEGQTLANAQAALGTRSNALAREMSGSLVPSITLATTRNEMLTAGLRLTDSQFAAVTVGAVAHRGATMSSADAVERLSGALTSANAEALAQFGIRLREGQTGADAQREAIRQLTAAAEANRVAVAANATEMEKLGANYDTARAAAGTFYALNANIATGMTAGARAAAQLARSLASGQSVASGFREATQAGQRFAESLPGIGSALGPLIAQMRAFWGLGTQVQNLAVSDDIRAQGRAGGAMSVSPTSTNYAQPRNRAEHARAVELGLVPRDAPGSAAAARSGRGGGGGGGGGQARYNPYGPEGLDVSRRELDRLRGQQTNAAEGTPGYEGGYTVPIGGSPSNRGSQGQAGRNAGGRAIERSTSRDAPRSGDGNANLGELLQNGAQRIDEMTSAWGRLKETGLSALGEIGAAWHSHFEAVMKGEEGFKKAMRGMASSFLDAGAKMALQESVVQFGLGWAAVGSMNAAGAIAHFTAAAVLGTVGGGAYALSAAAAGSSGGRSTGAASRYDRPERTMTSDRRESSGPSVLLVFYLAAGAITGGENEHATQDWLARMAYEGMARNGMRRERD